MNKYSQILIKTQNMSNDQHFDPDAKLAKMIQTFRPLFGSFFYRLEMCL